MSENKEEDQNSTASDVKDDPDDENSPKDEEKALDESSKDSAKESAKEESEKSESEDEEATGLLDRPVEVTGCRARKKVERLELSFVTPKEKQYEIPEGKGQKLGDCPRIEHQIQKNIVSELKPLHKILFNRAGSANEIKKNIRKFSGFTFEKESQDFARKKAMLEKLTASVLKHVCEILDLERSGTKEDIIMRILEFLLKPKDSGKKIPAKKKSTGKDKKKAPEKKSKDDKKTKTKKTVSSDEELSENESGGVNSAESSGKEDSDSSDKKPKKKKPDSKPKAKKEEKKEKSVKVEKKSKGTKRKSVSDDSGGSSDDEPLKKKPDEPPAKKSKHTIPSDEEIKKLVKEIVESSDLEVTTMKNIIHQVYDAYPNVDLNHKREFIKTTIKEIVKDY